MTLRPLPLLVAVLGLLLVSTSAAKAQLDFFKEEKPKSAPATYGNDKIAITATLQPVAARRGQNVELRLNLDIKPGFHAYPTKQSDANAQSYVTTVDVLSAEAAKKPRNERKNFPPPIDLVGDYRNSPTVDKPDPMENITARAEFEGKATITGILRVKSDLNPGKHDMLVNVMGSVCDEKVCTQFTAAIPLTLTVTAEEALASPAPPPRVVTTQGQERIQVSAALDPLAARRGQELNLKISYDIRPGFHSYPTKQSDPNAQPFVTNISFAASEDRQAKAPAVVELVGDWKNSTTREMAEPKLDIKRMDSFPAGKATIEGVVRIKPDTKPGLHPVVVRVHSQVCEDDGT